MSIFISLASYREQELLLTIETAIKNAANPKDLHFGVYSQVADGEHPDLSHIPNLTEVVVPYYEARGAGYARAQVMNMFQNQDYFLQIDAHSILVKDWDKELINLYKKIQKENNNDRVVISYWGKPYTRDPKNNKIIYGYEGDWAVKDPHYTKLWEGSNSWYGKAFPMPEGLEYHESAVVLGGFIFADKRIVEEVPYDKDIAWLGEEVVFSIRAYTRGWKIYSPYVSLLWHNYYRHGNVRVWYDRPDVWDEYQRIGNKKTYEVILGKVKGTCGIGDRKLFKEYILRFDEDMSMIKKAAQYLDEMKKQ